MPSMSTSTTRRTSPTCSARFITAVACGAPSRAAAVGSTSQIERGDRERAARRMVHVPMGRFGEADEIAAVVAFLASDDASFITAASYLVDGGISAAYTTPL